MRSKVLFRSWRFYFF